MGILLTWLVERPADDQTFVALTMNRVDGINPESFRAGRFDKIFHTSLPDGEGRWDIMRLHMAKTGVDPALYTEADVSRVLSITDGFSGAELEQALVDARFAAFARSGQVVPTVEELVGACSQIHSARKMDPDNINAIEEFCRTAGTHPVAAPRLPRRQARAQRSMDLFEDN